MQTTKAFKGEVSSLKAVSRKPITRRSHRVVTRAAALVGEVPDMNKRNIMNLLLLGAVGAPAVALAGPFAYFFVPQR